MIAATTSAVVSMILAWRNSHAAQLPTTLRRRGFVPLPQVDSEPTATAILVPAAIAQQVVPRFLQDPTFSQLHDHFTAQGMNFVHSRAKVAIFVGPDGDSQQNSSLLTVLPSFKSFSQAAPSHEAASIVGVLSCDTVGGVLAGHVVVSHNPFTLSQFSILEVENGQIVTRTATRSQLESMTAADLATQLGPPAIDVGTAQVGPSVSDSDMRALATQTLTRLLRDSYAAPLYPPGAVESLVLEAPLVQKWATVQRLRYTTLLGITVLCTSTSTSSNACTSTSSSIFNAA